MFERFTRKSLMATGAALLAALGVGGAAVAQSGSQSPSPSAPAVSQKAEDQPGQEPAGTEQDPATEQESGTEQANDDGPGGHADEPGNPNADHQYEGQE